MTLKLPKSGKEMQDWEWKDYEPYFDYLLKQEVNKQNIEEWMKYWSNLSELIGEVGTEVYIATTVDTTDEDGNIIHRGISQRFFSKSFTIANDVEVRGAELKDGLLTVALERIIPEAKKAKTIEIK